MKCLNYIILIFAIYFHPLMPFTQSKAFIFFDKQKKIFSEKLKYKQVVNFDKVSQSKTFQLLNNCNNKLYFSDKNCISVGFISNNYSTKFYVTDFKKRKLFEEDSVHFKLMINKLDSIYINDQFYRKQLIQKQKVLSDTSLEILQLFEIIRVNDSLNLTIVSEILDKYGWLGEEQIGGQRNKTIFLVIQHSKVETQEKYLPLLKFAVKNKKASSHQLCLLEDRISISRTGKQIYGTQIGRNAYTGEYYILPIQNPKRFIKKRNKLGLIDYQEYLSFWGLKWDIREYYNKLDKQRISTEK